MNYKRFFEYNFLNSFQALHLVALLATTLLTLVIVSGCSGSSKDNSGVINDSSEKETLSEAGVTPSDSLPIEQLYQPVDLESWNHYAATHAKFSRAHFVEKGSNAFSARTKSLKILPWPGGGWRTRWCTNRMLIS